MITEYLRNRAAMAAMAEGIGARFVTVLQPYIHLRKTLTANEKTLPSMSNYAYRDEFMKMAMRRLRSELAQQGLGNNAIFIDGTTAFDQANEDCFIDEVHLTRRGNELLLQHITDGLSQTELNASKR